MRCSEASRLLQLYIDMRLSLNQVRVLEEHLTQCTTCRDELLLLEEVASSLRNLQPVTEPADLTVNIMRLVTITPQRHARERYSLLRPSLPQLLVVVLLATITTFGIIWNQPALRPALPFANGHDPLSQAFFAVLALLVSGNSNTLSLALWIGGTLLGVCITLALVGNDIRHEWFKAMVDHLPVAKRIM
ncbi:MAG: anti-sigma factor family protein [Ktedonobacteraceae bacterium]|jgi:predicted anti-sigma-YlaC factor YlaD